MSLSSLITSYAGEGIGVLIVVLTLIQISPIKINPWSAIAKKIRNVTMSARKASFADFSIAKFCFYFTKIVIF